MKQLRSLVVCALVGLAMAVCNCVPASAATARVSFSPAVADPQYATKLTVNGSGFQEIQGGFGGIYVAFGIVNGTWQPSKGGVSGTNYVYVQDTESKDNHGYLRFLAFQGDSTAYAANGMINPDGSWSTDLIIPGPTFPARGRTGAIEQINCLKVQCGIITFGAHGVVNPQNETFTPITFAAAAAAATPKPSAPAVAPAATAVPSTATPLAAPTASPLPSPSTSSGVVIGSTTAAGQSASAYQVSTKAKAGSNTAAWVGAGVALLACIGVIAWRRLRTRTGRGA